MKKLIFFFLACLFFTADMNAQAESYRDFEWDIVRIGYALPSGAGVGSGIAFGTEPRYNLKDNLSIGLRLEFALYGAGDDLGTNVDIGAAGSYTLIGDYYFKTDSGKRPFAGLGVGLFSGSSVEINGGGGSADAGSSIGVTPRVGYEFGHLRLSAEYNLTFDSAVADYIGIHLGITLFGGYNG